MKGVDGGKDVNMGGLEGKKYPIFDPSHRTCTDMGAAHPGRGRSMTCTNTMGSTLRDEQRKSTRSKNNSKLCSWRREEKKE